MEDGRLLRKHRMWLPFVIARRGLGGDVAFVRGWREAYRARKGAIAARNEDSKHRKLSDTDIFSGLGIAC
jgi:hypothetical protein